MDIDYLFVGISRGNRNDYKELYRRTAAEVFAVALSHVRDRTLARDISVETYKRVWMYAYSYNTDMDGRKWLLEIARNLSVNALLDKELLSVSQKERLDNLSMVLIDTVSNLSADRGKILLLSSVTGLDTKSLASFLWYGTGSFRSEYKNAIRELEGLNFTYKELDIPATIKDNFPECVPDMWNLIISDASTPLAYTSHEVLSLDDGEYAFSDSDPVEDAGTAKIKSDASKKDKLRKNILIACIGAMVLIGALIAFLIIKSENKDTKKTDYTEYFGSPQYNTKIMIAGADGKIYYSDTNDDYAVYIADTSAQTLKGKKASGIFSKDFAADGKYLYYRSLEDGYIYRALADGTCSEKFSDIPASNITLYGDLIYFSGQDGIYSMSKDGGESSMVYDCSTDSNLERYDIEVNGEGTVFFSAGAWKGIHYLRDYKGETTIDTLFIDEAYTLQCEGDRMYFTYLGSDELYIYYFEMSELEEKVPRKVDNIHPGTGAFYVKGGYIYYEGYSETEKGMEKYGVYRIPEEGGTPELIIPCDTKSKMYISDLYVYDNIIFCFYSTGEKNAKTKLESRLLDSLDSAVKLF